MLLVEKFLNQEKLEELRNVLAPIDYVDGRTTAGPAASQVKKNTQANDKHPNYQKANELVRQALVKCEPFQLYAYPHKVTPIRFARYEEGMYYGEHVDQAILTLRGAIVRTDLSFTIFLTPSSEYEGGELVVDMHGVEKTVKGECGDLFVYESGFRHRVNELTRGSREVAVGWIQSLFRGHEERRIMRHLNGVCIRMLKRDGKTEDFSLLNDAYISLERLWGEE